MVFVDFSLSPLPRQVRLLRAETESLRIQNSELKMKTQVELEALQEQLRVRKEKQYQLLEKLQGEEEAKRQAEDQVCCHLVVLICVRELSIDSLLAHTSTFDRCLAWKTK